MSKGITNEGNEYVTIPMDTYVQMLNHRRMQLDRKIPDCIWNFHIDIIMECGAPSDPEHAAPSRFVDDLVLNCLWGSFDEYQDEDETDDEFIRRMERKGHVVFPKERIVYIY